MNDLDNTINDSYDSDIADIIADPDGGVVPSHTDQPLHTPDVSGYRPSRLYAFGDIAKDFALDIAVGAGKLAVDAGKGALQYVSKVLVTTFVPLDLRKKLFDKDTSTDCSKAYCSEILAGIVCSAVYLSQLRQPNSEVSNSPLLLGAGLYLLFDSFIRGGISIALEQNKPLAMLPIEAAYLPVKAVQWVGKKADERRDAIAQERAAKAGVYSGQEQ